MERHPGGAEATLRLIELAGIDPPCRVIDLGAGTGEAVRLLRSLGFEALGIDLAPGADVERGDILDPPFAGGSFDAALCQCSFYLTGAPELALIEAARLIRPGGALLFSDICPGGEPWLRRAASAAGFDAAALGDDTENWKRYYINALWRGEAVPPPKGARTSDFRYLYAVLIKRRNCDGRI